MAHTQNLQHNYYVNTRESKKSTIHPRKKVEGPHADASCSYESKTVDEWVELNNDVTEYPYFNYNYLMVYLNGFLCSILKCNEKCISYLVLKAKI